MIKLESFVARAESVIASAALILLLGLSLLEIAARNFLQTAIPGADVLNRYLVLWVSLLGAVIAVPERHIKIDAIAVWLSDEWRRRLERPILSFSACVCGALSWAAARFWREEWLNTPAAEQWITALGAIVPVSLLLLTLHFALRFAIGPHAMRSSP